MSNTVKDEAVIFQDYFNSIMSYVDSKKPSVRETLEFVGALTYSVVDLIDMTEKEKKLYIDVYNRLIKRSLLLKETREPAERKARQPELSMR